MQRSAMQRSTMHVFPIIETLLSMSTFMLCKHDIIVFMLCKHDIIVLSSYKLQHTLFPAVLSQSGCTLAPSTVLYEITL